MVIDPLRVRFRVVAICRRLEQSAVPTCCTAFTWAEVHAGLRRGKPA